MNDARVFKTVGVVGCGLMGSGIAQVCAQSGYRTIVCEVDERQLKNGLARIKAFLEDGVARGKVTAEARDAAMANLAGTTAFADLVGCDLIVEAIIENLDEKRAAYGTLDALVDSDVIFCSNTSSL